MVLAVCAFLIIFVAPIHFMFLGDPLDRLIISLIQVIIAVLTVIVLAFALSKLKKMYMQRQLRTR
jgi:ABC-type maltose transport system permease subunit